MMDEIRELYQEVILDHNKRPHNFRKMDDADSVLEGFNPLCGDHYTFYLRFDGDSIAEVSFEGSGCAISKASASIMTAVLQGKDRREAEVLFELFTGVVTGKLDPLDHIDELGKLAAFAGVAEFPVRVKCATLPWHTMHGALHGEDKQISTE
ncbi:MAG: SUF system NifU family Fe-S cluster assembly protein [Bacteroidota bacterium]|nr:SUF system NifU family Fe-S cluster assembly protein [Bacteroidota bacterium]